ncbi:hypothetical protein WSK_1630 [Novosphingobium sp. Rr 2-17]|nr:hypothetical protein WSK_1630 [Novosphingobium sp. Rr 2-17]
MGVSGMHPAHPTLVIPAQVEIHPSILVFPAEAGTQLMRVRHTTSPQIGPRLRGDDEGEISKNVREHHVPPETTHDQ